MSRRSCSRASRLLSQALQISKPTRPSFLVARSSLPTSTVRFSRASFSTCIPRYKGIMPDTESPSKESSDGTTASYGVKELGESDFHEIADQYLENVFVHFERLQDTREDIDIEFSSGVMTITHTEIGTYVINKQPPNKQIWLSSPISGPKRYDWCVVGDGQGDKEDSGAGYWIYARDGSSLSDLIMEELGVDVSVPAEE